MLGLLVALERHISSLSTETDAEEIHRLNAALHALRDSAGIYLSWARQFAKLVAQGTEADEAELMDLFSEGGEDFQNPIFG